MSDREYSLFDQGLIQLDQQLGTFFSEGRSTYRSSPADGLEEPVLSESERLHSGGLMRVNHAGEVSAQALYYGQALTSRDEKIRETMQRSAAEEFDHLDWCQQRLDELGTHTSYLNPFWYLGSFSLGFLAGLAGDRWSLGFIAETEKQVVEHLQSHLERLPADDIKSRVILQQMAEDEARHGVTAQSFGGVELPAIVKILMKYCSRIMTLSAYRI